MRTVFIITLVLFAKGAFGQAVLDKYITEGLANNIVLKQRNIGLDKAMLSLKIAGSYFAPSVSLQGSYTSGEGGRRISIPVGDLMNPVYQTLNQLTGSDQFPQISNVNQNFFPHNFYDARVHTTMPLVNTDLIYNRKIAQQQVVLQEFEVDIYRRELIRNIKVAYYNYLSATEAVKIYASALERGEEAQRVSESLAAHGKALPVYVLRSKSEVESIRTQHADAQRQVDNAGLYFNFLLNRSGNEPIEVDNSLPSADQGNDSLTVENREELKLIREAISLNQNLVRMNQLFWVPKLNGFLDLGSQESDWRFTQQSKYYLLGLQLEIPLFQGQRNRNRTKLASLDLESSKLSYQGNQLQLNLSAQAARNSLLTAHQNYRTAQLQFDAARSYQRLIEKGYQEGVNTFIESVDARNQLTQAALQVTINKYRTLSAAAQYERETAAYPLPTNEN